MTMGAFFTARRVIDRYGVSVMALKHWMADKESAFPRPVEIKRRKYFLKSEILPWEETRRQQAA
ncbi:DNA-binding protein [Ochrobactrum vermis]|uniref:DNA-binding protein n=1 Tax=Ochrobactrum vermis TaxID=1827297 RepID=A0ABU8PHY2_9HYPH|nr:helix-turn-helix domain-containing protein [Ochrobactrum vermis]PQZ26165.1 helix-turn-helix domain-containing protein [Ochrobactrum vermis]